MRLNDRSTPLFEVGRVVITAAADAEIQRIAHRKGLDSGAMLASLVSRHQFGDWGETCKDDRERNESAIGASGGRIHSVYDIEGTTFWVITEGDRSSTMILLPDDY